MFLFYPLALLGVTLIIAVTVTVNGATSAFPRFDVSLNFDLGTDTHLSLVIKPGCNQAKSSLPVSNNYAPCSYLFDPSSLPLLGGSGPSCMWIPNPAKNITNSTLSIKIPNDSKLTINDPLFFSLGSLSSSSPFCSFVLTGATPSVLGNFSIFPGALTPPLITYPTAIINAVNPSTLCSLSPLSIVSNCAYSFSVSVKSTTGFYSRPFKITYTLTYNSVSNNTINNVPSVTYVVYANNAGGASNDRIFPPFSSNGIIGLPPGSSFGLSSSFSLSVRYDNAFTPANIQLGNVATLNNLQVYNYLQLWDPSGPNGGSGNIINQNNNLINSLLPSTSWPQVKINPPLSNVPGFPFLVEANIFFPQTQKFSNSCPSTLFNIADKLCFNFSWSLLSINPPPMNPKVFSTVASLFSSSSSSVVSIPPYTLPVLSTLNLYVQITPLPSTWIPGNACSALAAFYYPAGTNIAAVLSMGPPSVSTSSSSTLSVQVSKSSSSAPLRARISGGNIQEIFSNLDHVIDASSSFDPDGGASVASNNNFPLSATSTLRFYFSPLASGPDFTPLQMLAEAQTNSIYIPPTTGSPYSGFSENSTITIPASFFSPGMVYSGTCTVLDPATSRLSTVFFILRVRTSLYVNTYGDTPLLRLSEQFSLSSSARFVANMVPPPLVPFKYTYTLSYLPQNGLNGGAPQTWTSSPALISDSTYGVFAFNRTLLPPILSPTSLLLTVTAIQSINNEVTSTASIFFTSPTMAPQGGNLTVSQNSGYGLSTSFIANAFGWYDPVLGNISSISSSSLYYSFKFIINGTIEVLISPTFTSSSSITFTLPTCSASNTILLLVDVLSTRSGLSTRFFLPTSIVTTRAPPLTVYLYYLPSSPLFSPWSGYPIQNNNLIQPSSSLLPSLTAVSECNILSSVLQTLSPSLAQADPGHSMSTLLVILYEFISLVNQDDITVGNIDGIHSSNPLYDACVLCVNGTVALNSNNPVNLNNFLGGDLNAFNRARIRVLLRQFFLSIVFNFKIFPASFIPMSVLLQAQNLLYSSVFSINNFVPPSLSNSITNLKLLTDAFVSTAVSGASDPLIGASLSSTISHTANTLSNILLTDPSGNCTLLQLAFPLLYSLSSSGLLGAGLGDASSTISNAFLVVGKRVGSGLPVNVAFNSQNPSSSPLNLFGSNTWTFPNSVLTQSSSDITLLHHGPLLRHCFQQYPLIVPDETVYYSPVNYTNSSNIQSLSSITSDIFDTRILASASGLPYVSQVPIPSQPITFTLSFTPSSISTFNNGKKYLCATSCAFIDRSVNPPVLSTAGVTPISIQSPTKTWYPPFDDYMGLGLPPWCDPNYNEPLSMTCTTTHLTEFLITQYATTHDLTDIERMIFLVFSFLYLIVSLLCIAQMVRILNAQLNCVGLNPFICLKSCMSLFDSPVNKDNNALSRSSVTSSTYNMTNYTSNSSILASLSKNLVVQEHSVIFISNAIQAVLLFLLGYNPGAVSSASAGIFVLFHLLAQFIAYILLLYTWMRLLHVEAVGSMLNHSSSALSPEEKENRLRKAVSLSIIIVVGALIVLVLISSMSLSEEVIKYSIMGSTLVVALVISLCAILFNVYGSVVSCSLIRLRTSLGVAGNSSHSTKISSNTNAALYRMFYGAQVLSALFVISSILWVISASDSTAFISNMPWYCAGAYTVDIGVCMVMLGLFEKGVATLSYQQKKSVNEPNPNQQANQSNHSNIGSADKTIMKDERQRKSTALSAIQEHNNNDHAVNISKNLNYREDEENKCPPSYNGMDERAISAHESTVRDMPHQNYSDNNLAGPRDSQSTQMNVLVEMRKVSALQVMDNGKTSNKKISGSLLPNDRNKFNQARSHMKQESLSNTVTISPLHSAVESSPGVNNDHIHGSISFQLPPNQYDHPSSYNQYDERLNRLDSYSANINPPKSSISTKPNPPPLPQKSRTGTVSNNIYNVKNIPARNAAVSSPPPLPLTAPRSALVPPSPLREPRTPPPPSPNRTPAPASPNRKSTGPPPPPTNFQ